MKIHLISYGNGNYKRQRESLKEVALKSSFFDEVVVFSDEDLDSLFIKHFMDIFNYGKGGGYWIWKPYLIKKVLDTLDEDDILIYCDAGCELNVAGEKRLSEYIEILKNAKSGSLAFELPHKEIEYTKQEVFEYFNVSEEVKRSNQLMATVILLKKCTHSVALVEKWFQTLLENRSMFTDEKEIASQNSEFIDHRHDQSVFSVIRKTYGSEIIADETYFLNFEKEGQAYPFWAMRKRG